MPGLRITVPVLKVLQAFLAAEATGRLYGLELSGSTRLKSGTLYPVLARLEVAGWVTSTWEEADPREAGRPRRRDYELSPLGRRAGAAALGEFATAQIPIDRPQPHPAEPAWK
jgi:PadR family transcriptional regulator PadR